MPTPDPIQQSSFVHRQGCPAAHSPLAKCWCSPSDTEKALRRGEVAFVNDGGHEADEKRLACTLGLCERHNAEHESELQALPGGTRLFAETGGVRNEVTDNVIELRNEADRLRARVAELERVSRNLAGALRSEHGLDCSIEALEAYAHLMTKEADRG